MDVRMREVGPGVWVAGGKHANWCIVRDGDGVTLVDTGWPGDRDLLLRSLELLGKAPAQVDAVVLTHAHADHMGSAEYFRSEVGTPVLVHAEEAANTTGERVEQASPWTLLRQTWRPSAMVWFWDASLRGKPLQLRRLGGATTFTNGPLDVPGRPVPVHTPGHTSGHVALHLPDRGALLVGDALTTAHALVPTAGPQLLPPFLHTDAAQALASLDRLGGLEAEVLVPGHGPPFLGSPASAVDAAEAAAARLGAGEPLRLEYGATMPLPIDEAFAFVSDPDHWPAFINGIQSVEKGTDWGAVGGGARLTTAVLGRSVTSDLEITEWNPPAGFRYLMRQEGRPTLDNRRTFREVPGGTRQEGTTQAERRSGPAALADRLQFAVIRRMYAEAMGSLPQAAADWAGGRRQPGGTRPE
jgi:glyoxylase-like metal-dependent hydrolase (beta-lactamase superfamily II)